MGISRDDFFTDQKINFPVTFSLRLIMISGDDDEIDCSHVLAILESQSIEYGSIEKIKTEKGKYYKLKISCTVVDEKSFHGLYDALSKFDRVKTAI